MFPERYQSSVTSPQRSSFVSQPYQDLLVAVAEKIGSDPAGLLATEEIVIDGLPIGMRLEGQGKKAEVLLCSLLGVPSPERWTETTGVMLLANHLWSGTGGAILGMLPENRMLTLSARQLLRDLDADRFIALLAKTADTGLAWRDFIAQDRNLRAPAPFAGASRGASQQLERHHEPSQRPPVESSAPRPPRHAERDADRHRAR